MAWSFILKAGDEVLLVTLLALVLLLTPHLNLELRASSYQISPWYLKILWGALALISWSIGVRIAQAQELENASNRLKSPLCALFALLLMLIFWIGLTYPIIISGIFYSKAVLFFLILAAPILSVWRVIFAEVINLPRFQRQAVIVGVNAAAEAFVRELRSAKRTGISVLGYISESSDEGQHNGGLPILGGRSRLRPLTQNGMIDIIIMAIDYKANPGLYQEAFEGAQRGISVVPVAAVYERTSGKIPLDHIGDQWSIAFSTERLVSARYLCWHKALDLVFGICGLVLLCILLPVLAPLIYLDSPGPVFFSQERAGYRGRTFRMRKFRSMCASAAGAEGGAWTSRGDARVTRVGRLLRATHLDELPQVLNIVRGDMSLIGPRPERPEYVVELEKSNPFYSYRLSIKPGLTGWAQVKYGYGSSEQDELVKLQYDLFYIKHRSFLLDVLILLKTVREVVLCHGV